MLLTGPPADPLELEQPIRTLLACVARAIGDEDDQPRAGSWMTQRRLRLVDELIEARLDDKLTVREVAAALQLSAGFFSRAFKAAVGKAPHDYIIDRRISRARTLLQFDKRDLSTIALASGFTSHAHMTATFQRRLGVAPRQLRSVLT